MSKKRDVIRIGDRVLVLRPNFVKRVGYPVGLADAKAEVFTLHGEAIEDFLHKIGVRQKPEKMLIKGHEMCLEMQSDPSEDKALQYVLKGLALMHLEKIQYGGRRRSVHVERREKYQNAEAEVVGRRVVQTGVRYPATIDYSGWEHSECEHIPAYLAERESIVLLELRFLGCVAFDFDLIDPWIERANVRKL